MFPRLVPHPAEPLDQVCLALQAQIEDSWVLLSWKIFFGNEEFKNLSHMAKKDEKGNKKSKKRNVWARGVPTFYNNSWFVSKPDEIQWVHGSVLPAIVNDPNSFVASKHSKDV